MTFDPQYSKQFAHTQIKVSQSEFQHCYDLSLKRGMFFSFDSCRILGARWVRSNTPYVCPGQMGPRSRRMEVSKMKQFYFFGHRPVELVGKMSNEASVEGSSTSLPAFEPFIGVLSSITNKLR